MALQLFLLLDPASDQELLARLLHFLVEISDENIVKMLPSFAEVFAEFSVQINREDLRKKFANFEKKIEIDILEERRITVPACFNVVL